jgi:2-phosphosulfolactate phosphatase
MYSTLSAHFLPAMTSIEELAAGVVVVIDVLRASTTITTALAAGAREVIPCSEVEQARQQADELTRRLKRRTAMVLGGGEDSVATVETLEPPPLLGGERGGLPIDGFDMGNSPSEYTPQSVGGRTIVFTTTNGTQALQVCRAAQRTVFGSFVNFSAVLGELTGDVPIHLLCAGTRGRITREDVLFAGAVVEKLAGPLVEQELLNDEAQIAREVWKQAMGNLRPPGDRANQRVADVLSGCQGGRNLIGVGLKRDIAEAAVVDRYDFAPVFDPVNWRIVKPSN